MEFTGDGVPRLEKMLALVAFHKQYHRTNHNERHTTDLHGEMDDSFCSSSVQQR